MKLWMLAAKKKHTIFFIAKTRKEVLKKFHMGLDNAAYNKLIADPSFEITEIVSLEALLGILPKEFQLSENVSF